MTVRAFTFLAACAVSAVSPALARSASPEEFRPSHDVAAERGPQIFNAVHNAMRQWGSSLHHNGMSYFLATVPEGVLFHHGNSRIESPTDPDWLAYEIEHAEGFARGRMGRPPGGGGPPDGGKPPSPPNFEEVSQLEIFEGDGPQQVIGDHEKTHKQEEVHGYLHVYRTKQPLRFLYVDGMGGGKTNMGTLDSQDYLLRGVGAIRADTVGNKRAPGGPMDEQQRAIDLCKLCKDWQLQGVIRMEAGFEIIKCDFADGLDQIQVLQRPDSGPDRRGELGNLEFMRGLAERYQGIGSTRTIIDYSSMVSAFFFPANLTNPNPKRPDLPRLSNLVDSELSAIKSYLTNVIEERREKPQRTIDWQDVSDLIVGRYADRLEFMAEKIHSISKMSSEVSFLLDVFIDYSEKQEDARISAAIERCTNFYLRSITPETEADDLIHAAFESVTTKICSTLFEVRDLVASDALADGTSLASAIELLRSLITTLGWARFKRCPACAVDEVCLIPMWPFGTIEDYTTPRCTNGTQDRDGENYWGGFRGRPGGPDGKGPWPSAMRE